MVGQVLPIFTFLLEFPIPILMNFKLRNRWSFLAIAMVIWVLVPAKTRAESAVFDLTQTVFDEKKAIDIPLWNFYWKKFLKPQEIDQSIKADAVVPITEEWQNMSFPHLGNLGIEGFATYQVEIRLPDQHPPLSLRVADIESAHKLWLNGKMVSEGGGSLHVSLTNRTRKSANSATYA